MKISIKNIGKEQDKYLLSLKKEMWLTENTLEENLKEIFPNNKFKRNKTKRLDSQNFRPDFLCEELKICIEFQGYQHFTDPVIVEKDLLKSALFGAYGYNFIEIPYFIQLDREMCYNYFYNLTDEKNLKDFSNGFPHGFIHPKSKSLGHFCYSGMEKAEDFLIKYSDDILKQCFDSLVYRSNYLNFEYEVLIPKYFDFFPSIEACNRLYSKNSLEIRKENFGILTDHEVLSIFENYKTLGGSQYQHIDEFKKTLDVFYKITKNIWVFGSYERSNGKLWYSRNEAWNCFAGYTGSFEENKLIFKAVDMFASYT